MRDEGYSNWYMANDLLSNSNNHDVNGAKFKDWRMPPKRELNLMYGVYTNGNGATLNPYYYWSSITIWRGGRISAMVIRATTAVISTMQTICVLFELFSYLSI